MSRKRTYHICVLFGLGRHDEGIEREPFTLIWEINWKTKCLNLTTIGRLLASSKGDIALKRAIIGRDAR